MAGVWTRNYSNILASFFAGPQNTNSNTNGTAEYTNANLSVRCMDGNYRRIFSNLNTFYGSAGTYFAGGSACVRMNMRMDWGYQNSLSNNSMYILLGKGANTGDLYETFALADMITSGIGMSTSAPPVTVTYDSTNHKYTKTASFGLTNTSISNISISEIALAIASTPDSSYIGIGSIIYYDTFEPITLEPYESVVITISQSFPLINYQPYPST